MLESLENAIFLVESTREGYQIFIVDDSLRQIQVTRTNRANYLPLLVRFIKFKFSAKACFIRVLGNVID